MSKLSISIDGRALEVDEGVSVAAALWNDGVERFRTSVRGGARGPICAMGICFECRVTIDGREHRRSCMVTCQDGMEIRTGD